MEPATSWRTEEHRLPAPAREVHVWRSELECEEWPAADGLPVDERRRAARLMIPDARRRWVAARWMLRGVLGRYLETDPARVQLRLGDRGKPALAEPSAPLRFSLSHSGDLGLIAVAQEREVGIDVEWIDPVRDVVKLAPRALDPIDAAAVRAASPDDRSVIFHQAWTRREAVAKCLGGGLTAPLPPDPVAVSDLDPGPAFAAAIAVAGGDVPPLRLFSTGP